MKRLFVALLLLSASCLAQGVGTVFFQASYTQSLGTVATPSFDHDTGSYSGLVTVTPSDSTSGAVMSYCTNVGSDCTPGTGYSVPIAISVTNTHLCVNATKSGYTTSATKCATYTITAVSLPVTDSFAGTGVLSASWATVHGSPTRASGFNCGAWGNCSAKFVGASFPNDQWVEFVLGTIATSQSAWIYVRASGTSLATLSGYMFRSDAGTLTLSSCTNDTCTWKASCGSGTAGHTYRLSATGTTISVTDNGTNACSVTDSTFTSGAVVVRSACSGTCPSITNFQAD